MQVLERLERIEKQADEARRQEVGTQQSFKSCKDPAEDRAQNQAPAPTPLTRSNLEEHTRQQRSTSPNGHQPDAQPQQHNHHEDDGRKEERGEAGLHLTADVEAGSTDFFLADYTGLAIGDVLELNSGKPEAEVVVIKDFGSIHLVAPVRQRHSRGVPVRRLIEGAGRRYGDDAYRAEQRGARSTNEATLSTSGDPDLEGFESHGSWSPRERAHQKKKISPQTASRQAQTQRHARAAQHDHFGEAA